MIGNVVLIDGLKPGGRVIFDMSRRNSDVDFVDSEICRFVNLWIRRFGYS